MLGIESRALSMLGKYLTLSYTASPKVYFYTNNIKLEITPKKLTYSFTELL